MQVTIWAYNHNEILNNIYFKQYRFINKSDTTFEDTYACQFVDTDIGSYKDDFNGCDTLLNLGYSYNANEYDDVYGLTPPAVGCCLLKGPSVSGNNLEMTAFYSFGRGDANVSDPPLGDSEGAKVL